MLYKLPLILAVAALTLAACDSATGPASLPGDASASVDADLATQNRGFVYTLSDAAGPNEVIVFGRRLDGSLVEYRAYRTRGTGSGGGLGAATDPIVLSPDGGSLYAVNRGSDNVTVFEVSNRGLRVRQVISSGGVGPISLAVSDGLVYVLNTGDGATPGTVVAFERRPDGRLAALAQGVTTLPEGFAGPPQVGLDPQAQTVVVTDRPSNQIVTYAVQGDGTLGAPVVTASAGVTPFGFEFDAAGRLFVTNANAPAGPVVDGSSVTAYALAGTALSVIEAEVPTTETAACWIRAAGRYLYATNTGSGTITGFEVQSDGSIDILDADGVTATTGANPRDLNVVEQEYVYAQSDGQLDAFRIGSDGSLTPIGTVSVPATARGVASR